MHLQRWKNSPAENTDGERYYTLRQGNVGEISTFPTSSAGGGLQNDGGGRSKDHDG